MLLVKANKIVCMLFPEKEEIRKKTTPNIQIYLKCRYLYYSELYLCLNSAEEVIEGDENKLFLHPGHTGKKKKVSKWIEIM